LRLSKKDKALMLDEFGSVASEAKVRVVEYAQR